MKRLILLCQEGPFIFLKFVRMLKTDIKTFQIEFLLQNKCRGAIEIVTDFVAHFEILRSILIN